MHTPALSIRAAALILACLGSAAQAHQVWIEHTGQEARLQFGEYGDNLREISPGALDKFKAVPVLEQSVGGKTERIAGQRTPTAFTYATPGAAAPQTLFAEAPYPLIDRSKAGKPTLLWRPAARWVASLAQPVEAHAPLDLVPTGRAGELRAVFNGQPLAKALVAVAAPSGWTREATTAADGTVRMALPWKGQYVAEVKHTDPKPGERDGEKFGETSFITTLTFSQAEGMDSPPLPAAAAR